MFGFCQSVDTTASCQALGRHDFCLSLPPDASLFLCYSALLSTRPCLSSASLLPLLFQLIFPLLLPLAEPLHDPHRTELQKSSPQRLVYSLHIAILAQHKTACERRILTLLSPRFYPPPIPTSCLRSWFFSPFSPAPLAAS